MPDIAVQPLRSTFALPKMDCSSEERMVRMALDGEQSVLGLVFDLQQRTLEVVHDGPTLAVLSKLEPLGLGARLTTSEPIGSCAFVTTFAVPKMDCPSEEKMVRMALEGESQVKSLEFDLANRKLVVVHDSNAAEVLAKLEPLGYGARIEETRGAAPNSLPEQPTDDAAEARLLWTLLAVNGVMFVVELAVGLWAQSTGLIADSLDMFADAAVYGMSLYAVGRTAMMKRRAAHVAGWLQIALAFGALSEVVRRFITGSEPVSTLMMGMGLVALAANAYCLVLVAKKKDAGAHMSASYIFSANDVIANAGVVVAGVLVAWTSSAYPDLIIGAIVAAVVLNGAKRILALR